ESPTITLNVGRRENPWQAVVASPLRQGSRSGKHLIIRTGGDSSRSKQDTGGQRERCQSPVPAGRGSRRQETGHAVANRGRISDRQENSILADRFFCGQKL